MVTALDGPVRFTWTPVGLGLRLARTTQGREANPPDPASLGIAWPAGAAYEWSAIVVPGVGTAEASRRHGFELHLAAFLPGGPGSAGDGAMGSMAQPTVHWAP